MNEETTYRYLPKAYTRRQLNSLYREIPLKDTTSRLLRKYFNAASNLYGIIPLRKLYDIITTQNKNLISEDEFLAFVEIARHECEDYYILGQSEIYTDGEETHLMDYEVINLEVIDEKLEIYHEILHGHQGKPYYIPPKKEFLAYNDMYYWEATEYALALREHLTTKLKLSDTVAEILFWEMYSGIHSGHAYLQDVFESFDKLDIHFENMEAAQEFMNIYNDFHNNVRMQFNRGHTPHEIFEMVPPKERVPKTISFGPNIRSAIASGEMDAEEMRREIMTMDMPNESIRSSMLKGIDDALKGKDSKKQEKVGRNEPCPCGSGKKYKHCCGK